MADLIQNTSLDFSRLRASAAKAIVLARRISGDITDDTQEQNVLSDLLDKVDGVKQLTTVDPEFKVYDRISSEDWNKFVESVFIDLRTIYDSIASLESVSKQMDNVTKADLTQTKAAILKAINQLRVYQFLRRYPQYQDLKLIDFIRGINSDKRTPQAVIDSDIRTLELAPKSYRVISANRAQNRRTVVNVTILGPGKKTGFDNKFSKENIIDTNPNNFWVEVLSSTAPISFIYEASWGSYQTKGMVAEVELDFSHVERANNMKLLPFSDYPYNIIDICYKESRDGNWITLPNFSIKNAIEDWSEFDFSYITIDTLRVVIEQPNYTRNISNVPTSLINRNALWSLLKEDEYRKEIHEIDLTTRQQGIIDVEPEQLTKLTMLDDVDSSLNDLSFNASQKNKYNDYSKYIDVLNDLADTISPGVGNEIREISSGKTNEDEDSIKRIITYDYLVGIRILQLSSVIYSPLGYYSSGEFVLNGTPVEVQLDTEETHPEFVEDDGVVPYRRTSVEYELEISPNSRFPIVPISTLDGANYLVRDELIKLTRGNGRLRFTPSASSVTIRKNGKRISMLLVTLDGRNINIQDADKNAIYTATYVVSEDATKVNFSEALNSTRLSSPEEFSTTDKENKITLKYYPYIIYEVVRDSRFWVKRGDDAIWDWNPDFFPISTGSIAINSGSTTITLTKDSVGDLDFSDVTFSGDIRIWIQNTNEILSVDIDSPSAPTSTVAYLQDLYTGSSITSSRFILGRAVELDGTVFGLNIGFYEPISVFVNGIKAKNMTDYFSRQHPALTPIDQTKEKNYQFIQAGKNLYFNGPIEGKITVQYNWLAQYLKLIATLRCNIPVQTIFTPKIDTAKLRVKTTEL